MKKIALIPAYEPDDNLIELLKKVKKTDLEPIVVDDGSGKEYEEIFKNAKKYSHVISYDTNHGKGYALKTGLKYIKEKNTEDYIVITMDSDGQHTVEDAIKLAKYVEENPTELALGMRPRGKNTPLRSRLGNGITRFIFKLTTGVSIYDTQTGLRAFSNKLMNTMLEIEGNRYEYEMNVLLELPQLSIKMKEIEIQTIYIDNNSKSHFNAFKDSIRIYKQILKFLMSSIISFIVDYVLYSILIATIHNITYSNIIARVISATTNYTINRKVVFKSKANIAKSLIQYCMLALVVLVINTTLLNILVKIIGINALIAKIIVEVILCTFNWIIQKRYIFNKKANIK